LTLEIQSANNQSSQGCIWVSIQSRDITCSPPAIAKVPLYLGVSNPAFATCNTNEGKAWRILSC